jgi:hypothetical protein
MENGDMELGNPGEDEIRALLKRSKTIAVVGFSPKPRRASHNVARQMQRMGYRIIPVRPGISEGLGETAYPDLASVPDPIDIVDVFRASENTGPVFDECLRLGLKTIWLQDGVVNLEAAERARAAGMTVIMNRCVLRDFTRLCV